MKKMLLVEMFKVLSLCFEIECQLLQTLPNEKMSDSKNRWLIIRKRVFSGNHAQSGFAEVDDDDEEDMVEGLLLEVAEDEHIHIVYIRFR